MAAPVYQLTGTLAASTNSTTVAPSYPANVAANDIAIAIITKDSDTTITAPGGEGWSEITTAVNGTAFRMSVFWKRLAGSESGTQTFTYGAAGGANNCGMGVIYVFRGGVTSGTPHEGANSTNGNTASQTIPSITYTAGARTLIFCDAFGDNVAGSPPGTGGYTEWDDQVTTTGNDGQVHIWGKTLGTGGGTDSPGNCTHSTTANPWVVIGFALKGVEPFGTVAVTLETLTASGAADLLIKGSVAQTLGAATLAAEGDLTAAAITGSLSQTLGALTAEAAGWQPPISARVGNIAGYWTYPYWKLTYWGVEYWQADDHALGLLTLSSNATISSAGGPVVGSLSQTLEALTVSGTAKLLIAGTSSQTLGSLTASATGTLPINATLSQTLGSLTVSATADLLIQSTLTATLGELTLAGSSDLLIQGTLAQTLGDLTLAASSSSLISGALSQTLGAVSLSAEGDLKLQATLSATLGAVTVSSDADLLIAGTVAQTLGSLTVVSLAGNIIGGSLEQTLGSLTAAAAGTLPIDATFSQVLGAAQLSSQGKLKIQGATTQTLEALTCVASAIPLREAALTQTLEGLTLMAYAYKATPQAVGRKRNSFTQPM